MIHSILQVLKNDLGAFLKKRLGEREEVVLLSQLMNNADGGFAVSEENRLICTLLNIEQERLNLNAPLGQFRGSVDDDGSSLKSVMTTPASCCMMLVGWSLELCSTILQSLLFPVSSEWQKATS